MEYEQEGLDLDDITYHDNSTVLQFMEGKLGLIALLNEECVRPGGSDTAFVTKVATVHGKQPEHDTNNSSTASSSTNIGCLVRKKGYRDYEFSICHYAGMVTYNATDFVTTNMDTIPLDLYELCQNKSTNLILQHHLTNERCRNRILSTSTKTIDTPVDHGTTTATTEQLDDRTANPSPDSDGTTANASTRKKAPSPVPKRPISNTKKNQRMMMTNHPSNNRSGGINRIHHPTTNTSVTKTTKTNNNAKNHASVGSTVDTNNNPNHNHSHRTVLGKFKHQLSTLMEQLHQTRTRYIRCIKPNPYKQSMYVHHSTTMEQLRCAGIVAAVTISRSTFPNRLYHSIVLDKFSCFLYWNQCKRKQRKQQQQQLRPGDVDDDDEDYDVDDDDVEEDDDDDHYQMKQLIRQLLTPPLRTSLEYSNSNSVHSNNINYTSVVVGVKDINNDTQPNSKKATAAFVIGKTRTYFRSGVLEVLEKERMKCLTYYAVQIQTKYRSWYVQEQYQKKRFHIVQLQAIVRMMIQYHTFHRTIRTNCIRVQCWYRCIRSKHILYNKRRLYCIIKIQSFIRTIPLSKMYQKKRTCCIVLQANVRRYIQHNRYKMFITTKREEMKLENQIVLLQHKLALAEEQLRVEIEQRTAEQIHAAKERSELLLALATTSAAATTTTTAATVMTTTARPTTTTMNATATATTTNANQTTIPTNNDDDDTKHATIENKEREDRNVVPALLPNESTVPLLSTVTTSIDEEGILVIDEDNDKEDVMIDMVPILPHPGDDKKNVPSTTTAMDDDDDVANCMIGGDDNHHDNYNNNNQFQNDIDQELPVESEEEDDKGEWNSSSNNNSMNNVPVPSVLGIQNQRTMINKKNSKDTTNSNNSIEDRSTILDGENTNKNKNNNTADSHHDNNDDIEDMMSALSEPTLPQEVDIVQHEKQDWKQHEVEQQTHDDQPTTGGSSFVVTRQQMELMEESSKMIDYLRSEVYKLRTYNQQLRTDLDLLKENNQRLLDANSYAGASFASLNQHVKTLQKQNDTYARTNQQYKHQIQQLTIAQMELRDEMKMKQATYVAEVQTRLQYEHTIQQLIDTVQEKCRDSRLVEELIHIAELQQPTSQFDEQQEQHHPSMDYNRTNPVGDDFQKDGGQGGIRSSSSSKQQQQQQPTPSSSSSTSEQKRNDSTTTTTTTTGLMSSFRSLSFWS